MKKFSPCIFLASVISVVTGIVLLPGGCDRGPQADTTSQPAGGPSTSAAGNPGGLRKMQTGSVRLPGWRAHDGQPVPGSGIPAQVSREVSVPAPVADFEEWALAFARANPVDRASMVDEGMGLAEARRKVVASLIAEDPEAAILLTPPPALRSQLPPEIESQLERLVAGTGFYGVKAVCNHGTGAGHDASCRIEHDAIIDGRVYEASIYGARLERLTEENASLYGVALDSKIALHEDDVVVRPAGDFPPEQAADNAFAAIYHGDTEFFDGEESLAAWGGSVFENDLPTAEAGEVFSPDSPLPGPTPPTVPFNEFTGSFKHQKGPKTMMVMLVQPSDGATYSSPPSFATLDAQLNTTSQNYYNNSYRQTWFGPKVRFPGQAGEIEIQRLVVTPVLQLPRTTDAYRDNFGQLQVDCKAAVEALGGDWTNNGPTDPDHFDRWVVMSNTKLINSTGLAYVGGKFASMGGSVSGGVAEHELGHNWGVVHANSWNIAKGEHPRAATGSNGEYDDGWDVMGGGNSSQAFNPLFREDLGFLERTRGEVLDVTASGTYRIYDYLDPYARNPTSNVRALILPMSSFTDPKRVFLGFGHLPGTDGGKSRTDWNRNAVTVHSQLSDGSNRIDTTPFSHPLNDADDSSIKIGRTYSEGPAVNGTQMYGGFHVTPITRGSTVVDGNTHEWIDVVVNYGGTSPNPPVASFPQAVYETPTGSALALAVSASDPNGDPLAYDWDFGDGSYSLTSSATQSKIYATPGIFLVTVWVSDMKGNTSAAQCWVNVGGQVQRPSDAPAATLGGVAYRYYEGVFTSLPDFPKYLPDKSGTVANVSLTPREQNDNFAFIFEGFLEVPADDYYQFYLTCDDGARMWIGGELLIDSNSSKSVALESKAARHLQAGRHAFRIEYFHKDGSEQLAFEWSTLTSPRSPVPDASLSQSDTSANPVPSVAITAPSPGSEFVVGSDILVSSNASDPDGVARVVFFGNGGYLGEDATAPYETVWPKVSVGTKELIALAYDTNGQWAASMPVVIEVVSPVPQPSIAINFRQESVDNSSLFFSDLSGAVYQQAHWNDALGLTGIRSDLVDDLGAPTTASVEWRGSANGNYGDGRTNADPSTASGRLFRGLLEIRNDESHRPTATIRDIPFDQYDVYVYFDLRNDLAKDNTPVQFVCEPGDGSTIPPVFGKNSLASGDSLGDFPNYDTWVGFREAVATSASAPDDELLGNYVVFRNLTAREVTVKADGQNPSVGQAVGFNAVQIVRVNSTIPNVVVRQTGGSTAVAEGGATDTLTVGLAVAPDGPVSVTLSPDAQLAVSPAVLNFTPGDWQSARAVTISAIDDAAAEGPHTGGVDVAVSADGTNYAGVNPSQLDVPVDDNDQPVVALAAGGLPSETGPATGFLHFTRMATSSVANDLDLTFQIAGTAVAGSDFTLSGAGLLAFDAGTGLGTVRIPAGQAQVLVTVTPINDSAAEGSEDLTATIVAGSGYAPGSAIEASLPIVDNDTVDYFTELFGDTNTGGTNKPFDLANSTLTFTPSGNTFTVVGTTATSFPSGTSSFTNFDENAMTGGNKDNGYWRQSLNAPFPFMGGSYSTAHVGTDGHVTFGSGMSTSNPTLSTQFNTNPKVTIGWSDLNPGTAGTVKYRRITGGDGNRAVFWWDAVRNDNTGGSVSMQLELFDDGRIRMTWLSMSVARCMVGFASGTAATMPSSPYTPSSSPRPFFESDLSNSLPRTSSAQPVFSTLPITLATTGVFSRYDIACSHAAGAPMAITAPTKPAWLSLVDAGNGTAVLSGTPPSSGTFDIVLRVTDATNTTEQSYALHVVPAGGNTLPVFTSVPVTAAGAGLTYSALVTASDADGHRLAFSAPTLPPWLSLTDHGNGTATIFGTGPSSKVQDHAVVLLVSDVLGSTTQSFSITLNTPPTVVLGSPSTPVLELPDILDTLHLAAEGVDDGLPASGSPSAGWSKVSGPGLASFENATTGETAVTFDQPGPYHLRFSASDGAGTTDKDVVVFAGTDPQATIVSGLEGWWKFDEGTGTTSADLSGNGRNMTFAGADMSGVGVFGTAFTSNGSKDWQADASFPAPAQFTVALWFNLASVEHTNDRFLFAWRDSGGNARIRLLIPADSRKLQFFSERNGTNGIWRIQRDIPAGEWIHLVVSYDSAAASADPSVYLNGAPVAVTEESTPTSTQRACDVFRIGNHTGSRAINGRIDDIRVYSRILPPHEVLTALIPDTINRAPDPNAGTDADAAPGQIVNLLGSVTDDGIPADPGNVTVSWSQVSGPAGDSFGNPASAETSYTLGGTLGTRVLSFLADDGSVRVSSQVVVNVAGALGGGGGGGGFDAWIAGYPGLSGADALPGADRDGDGLSNFVEFAMGLSPTEADGTDATLVGMGENGGQNFVELTYRQRTGGSGTVGVDYTADGVRYAVEFSTTLDAESWQGGASVVEAVGNPVDNGDGTETVTVRLRTPVSGGDAHFLRLHLESVP